MEQNVTQDYSFAEGYNQINDALVGRNVIVHKDFHAVQVGSEADEAQRDRAKGQMATHHPDSYFAYAQLRACQYDIKPKTFVVSNLRGITAKTVFDFGDVETAGHCDDTALLALKPCPYHTKMMSEAGSLISQENFLDLVQDLMEVNALVALNAENQSIPIAQVCQAIKNIKITASGEKATKIMDLGYQESSFEEATASAEEGQIPARLVLWTPVYLGLTESQSVAFRLKVKIREEGAFFLMQPVNPEKHSIKAEEVLMQMVIDNLGEVTEVTIGDYAKF